MMEPSDNDDRSPYLIYVPAIIALVFLLWKMVSQDRSSQSRKPENGKDIPGPRGLPIIGNAHQLGKDSHKSFLSMSQSYGDVFRVKLGTHPVVVLSRSSAIKEALISQTIEFAGRPSFLGVLEVLSVRGGGLAFMSYDDGWKMHRELVDKAFLDFSDGGQVGMLESHVLVEANEFLKFVLKGETSANCEPKNLFRLAVVNIMTNLLSKIRREFDHPDLQKLIDCNHRVLEASASANIVNFLPCLKRLLPGKLRQINFTNQHAKTLLDVYVDESMKDYKPESKRDILHYLRTLCKDVDKDERTRVKLTDVRFQAGIYEIFGAGYENVSTTLMWVFIYLVNFPELQKEMQDEIDNVVGRDGLPAVADREKLPLTEAFIAEVFRHVSVVPFVVPHKTIQDTVLGAGYDFFIPKDTIVFMSLYSIHNDPEQWDNPAIFNPKRFLLEGGGGLDKKKVSSVMQFGAGIRRCVGCNVAPIILLLFISNVLHQCSLKSVDGQQLSTNGTTTTITIQPPDYQVIIKRR